MLRALGLGWGVAGTVLSDCFRGQPLVEGGLPGVRGLVEGHRAEFRRGK